MAAYMSRMTDDASQIRRSYKNASSFQGDGIDTQLSYVFLQVSSSRSKVLYAKKVDVKYMLSLLTLMNML
jgi:hypothetical protein